MSLMSRESSHGHESLQCFSPIPTSTTTPNGTASTTTEYEENETTYDKNDTWIEPPLKAPTPSFEDHGLDRTDQHVFRYIAPLGHLPPAHLIREIFSKKAENSMRKKKHNHNASEPAPSTADKLGAPVNGLQQRSTATSFHLRADKPAVNNSRKRLSSRFITPDRKQHVQDLKGRKRRSIISRRQYAI
jgi:hypothetical protein